MKAVYVVTPLALLAAFAGYVVPASARLDAALAARAAAAEQRHIEERCAHDKDRERASAELAHQAALRREAQAEKERVAREIQERRDQTLFDNLAETRRIRETLRNEIAALEDRLQQLVVAQDNVAASLHAARAALETRQIERRNADLELQRMTLLVAEAVDASIIAGTPLFPPLRTQ